MNTLKDSEIAINQRFVEIYNRLKATYQVEGKSEFCVALGMPKANFSRYEKNQRAIPGLYLDELEEKFDINKDYLIHGIGSMFKKDPKPSGHSIANTGPVSGGQNLTGWGTQHAHHFTPAPSADSRVTTLEEKIAGLEKLIAEKDERILELKETIAHLRNKS